MILPKNIAERAACVPQTPWNICRSYLWQLIEFLDIRGASGEWIELLSIALQQLVLMPTSYFDEVV